MHSVRLPILDENDSFSEALNRIKSAQRSGVVVIDSKRRAHLIEAETLRELATQRPTGIFKERGYPAIDLSAQHGTAGGQPTVDIQGNTADVSGLEPRLTDRLRLAVTWYVCSASPAHTYSPQEFRRLKTKNGTAICDVDGSNVK